MLGKGQRDTDGRGAADAQRQTETEEVKEEPQREEMMVKEEQTTQITRDQGEVC